MTLPAAHPRTRFHTRQFHYQCFYRDDGLWDIDAELSDVKDYDYALQGEMRPAGVPIHRMLLRLTVDEHLTIREVCSTTVHSPFPQCTRANDPMRTMIGVTIGRGWRSEIERRLGGVKGCTHLRDLLINAATAAIQAISAHSDHLARLEGRAISAPGEMPHFLGKCMAWALDGEAVKRYEPTFFVPASQQGGDR